MLDKEKEQEKRKKINEDILKRLKAGEQLQDPANKTWFPPRPVIQKDQEHVKQLYGNDVKIVGIETIKKLECVKDTAIEKGEEDDTGTRKDEEGL